MITIAGKQYGVGADSAIVNRVASLMQVDASTISSLVDTMMGAYREAVQDKGLPRWDPRVADSRRTAQYVQQQVGTDYYTAFTFCSALYTLAKEGGISTGVWDPAVAERQADARVSQAVKAVRRAIAPTAEVSKDVGKSVFSAIQPILLLGALGLAVVVAVKFLPKREGA